MVLVIGKGFLRCITSCYCFFAWFGGIEDWVKSTWIGFWG